MWQIKILEEARKDYRKLDRSLRRQILSGIKKVSTNPLPKSMGGYGKPLGSKKSLNLTGFFKIKYRGIGVRVVYTLVRKSKVMNIAAISTRGNRFCYKLAGKRKQKYGDDVFKDSFKPIW